jgi:hypothetical protein
MFRLGSVSRKSKSTAKRLARRRSPRIGRQLSAVMVGGARLGVVQVAAHWLQVEPQLSLAVDDSQK